MYRSNQSFTNGKKIPLNNNDNNNKCEKYNLAITSYVEPPKRKKTNYCRTN